MREVPGGRISQLYLDTASRASISTLSTYMSGLGSTFAYGISWTGKTAVGAVVEVRVRNWLSQQERVFLDKSDIRIGEVLENMSDDRVKDVSRRLQDLLR